jgi:hypothetical protein
MSVQVREAGQVGEDRHERGQDRAGSQGLAGRQGRLRQNESASSARASAVLREASRLFSAVSPSSHSIAGPLTIMF